MPAVRLWSVDSFTTWNKQAVLILTLLRQLNFGPPHILGPLYCRVCRGGSYAPGIVLHEHNTVLTSKRSASRAHAINKLFTSCIRRCVVPRACDWMMSALSSALLSLLFFHIGRQRTWTYVHVRYIYYRRSACRQSVCNVRALYSAGWNFRQFFFAVWYLGHPMRCMENFTEIVPGEPLRRGI